MSMNAAPAGLPGRRRPQDLRSRSCAVNISTKPESSRFMKKRERSSQELSAEAAAPMLAAPGSLPRLAVFSALLRAGHDGKNLTEVQTATVLPASTLEHHLMALVGAGLVAQQRNGREVMCTARFEQIRHPRRCPRCMIARAFRPGPWRSAHAPGCEFRKRVTLSKIRNVRNFWFLFRHRTRGYAAMVSHEAACTGTCARSSLMRLAPSTNTSLGL